MRRSDILLTKESIPRRSPNDDIFPKEDSPELPVPRRKTNTLSILRKLVRECDGNEIGSSSYEPSHRSRAEEVPDHCWVGEYLDDEQAERSAAALIHETRMKDYLRRKREGHPMPITAKQSLPSSEITKPFLSSSYGGNFDSAPRAEESNREVKELQRKERAKEEEILKMMLELENLRRDAKLRQSKDAAKVFDYDHGVPERSNYQDRYLPPSSLKYDPFDVMSPESSRQLNLQESAKYSSQVARVSTGDSSSVQHLSGLFRKVTKNDYNDYVQTERRDGVTLKAEETSNRLEKSHGRRNEHFGSRSESVDVPPRRRVMESPIAYNGPQLRAARHDLSGSLTSFGSAMSHRKEDSKANSSQSYQDYVNEIRRKMEIKDPDTQQDKEALQIEPDGSASHLRKGLPISVLTTRHPERYDQDTRSQVSPNVGSYHEAPPVKIKPEFEHVSREGIKNDYHGSSALAESFDDIDASTRHAPGSFNDTRKVMVDDEDQRSRRRNAGSVDQSPRDVDYHRERRHVVEDKHDMGFANDVRKRSYREDRRVEKSSKPALAGKRNHTEYLRGYSDSDEQEGEPFLHKRLPKHPKADTKDRRMPIDASRSHRADTRHAESKDRDARAKKYYRDADRGYERSSGEFGRNVSGSPSLDYTKSMPKPMDHFKTANVSATRYSEDRETDNVTRVSEVRISPSGTAMYRRASFVKPGNGGPDRDSAKRDEYIDQYFDRQIKIRTGTWQDDRSVERPRQKPQGAWAEEVDRYVNMLAGNEKSRASDDEGRFEDKARKYGRGRDSSHNPRREYRRGGKSHTRSPSPGDRSVRSVSGTRGSGGRDERRFERRSPRSNTRDRRYSPDRFGEDKTPRAARDHRELDRRTVVQPDRKRTNRSPSPVPLMPPGWQASVKSRDLEAGEGHDRVDDVVPRKVVDRDRSPPAKRTKDFVDLRNDLKNVRTAEIVRARVEIDERTNHSKTQTRNFKEQAKDRAPKSGTSGSSDGTVHLDGKRVTLNSTEAPSVRKYPAILFTVSNKGSADKTTSSGDGRTKSSKTPVAVSMDQTGVSTVAPLNQAPHGDVAARSQVIGSTDSLPAESKKDAAARYSVSDKTTDSSKNLSASDKLALSSSKTRVSDFQKNPTSKKLAISSSKTKVSHLQQNVASKKLVLTSSKTDLQKKPIIGAKAMPSSETGATINTAKAFSSRRAYIIVDKDANDGSQGQSMKSGKATSASAAADNVEHGRHWMQHYKNWFSTVLEPVLSKDEQVASLGWRDPVRFLNCVTTGNKRAMSHIPRGEHAKELLRFIALNKKDSDAGGIVKKSECSTDTRASASNAEMQQKNEGKEARIDEGLVKNVISAFQKDKPVSHHAKYGLTDSSEEKSRNDIKIHKEEIPGSISGLADGDDSVTVSISQPKSLNLNPSKLPETNRKEDRDVTMQKGVVTPKPGATRKDKCLPAKDPVTILDSDKKKTAPAKKKPLPSIKQKIKQPQDKPPPGSVDTSNSISKSQSKQRRRPSQENESKQPAHKSKPQVSERRKSATASSRSAVEPKHAKIMASGSRQPTSKRPAEDRKLDVKAADGRKSRLDSHQRDRSDDKIIISTEEPILSAAQRDLLPAFKKRVERTTVRQLNVLYSIDRYDKANVISAAKDSVSAFKLSNGGSQGFSTEHALYYMSALFKDPPPDSVDDVNRQYRKYNLDGPEFEFSLRNFYRFQNVVLTLCKDRLDRNRIAMSQDQIKKSFVRQQAEFLFPQFCNEGDSLIKLWCWHERMKIVLDNESSTRMHFKLQPFPDNHGQSLEDTIAQWTKRVILGPLYNQIDCFGYSVVCAIKTELMKRRPHVSRQEAMKILLQSWIRNHFEDVEKRRKPAKETVIEAVEDAPESELMVLDEVYSDESEDENEFDITDDSESVQIDLF